MFVYFKLMQKAYINNSIQDTGLHNKTAFTVDGNEAMLLNIKEHEDIQTGS